MLPEVSDMNAGSWVFDAPANLVAAHLRELVYKVFIYFQREAYAILFIRFALSLSLRLRQPPSFVSVISE